MISRRRGYRIRLGWAGGLAGPWRRPGCCPGDVARVTADAVGLSRMIEHGSRRLLHLNVTAHPTAAWTLQQLREALVVTRGE